MYTLTYAFACGAIIRAQVKVVVPVGVGSSTRSVRNHFTVNTRYVNIASVARLVISGRDM